MGKGKEGGGGRFSGRNKGFGGVLGWKKARPSRQPDDQEKHERPVQLVAVADEDIDEPAPSPGSPGKAATVFVTQVSLAGDEDLLRLRLLSGLPVDLGELVVGIG